MAKICKPFTLFAAAAAALALCTVPSVLAQDANSVETINFSTDVAAAPSAVDDRSADNLAQSANEAAAPDVENRPVDSVMGDDAVTSGADASTVVSADAVGNDADASTVAGDDMVGNDADGSSTTTEDTVILGANILSGWSNLELDNDAVQVLVDALSDPKYYDPTIKSSVCVLQINSGKFQPVAGTNYRYQILGCPINFADELGACRNRECASSVFEVTVYQQTWTNTLQVSSITQSA